MKHYSVQNIRLSHFHTNKKSLGQCCTIRARIRSNCDLALILMK